MAWRTLLLSAVIAGASVPAWGQRQTRNIVLITVDGLRWQEVFRGIDLLLMKEESTGMAGAPQLLEQFRAESSEARRERLLPFLWREIVPRGTILGNRGLGSTVEVTNRFRVSYPGYSEILTGRAQDDVIDDNDPIQNPSSTVLEVLRKHWRLEREQVAVFASWSVFRQIAEHQPGSVIINAGYEAFGEASSDRARHLSRLQFSLLTPWRTVRHDFFTFELALEYLRTRKPRVLYIAFGEPDDWAHEKRYDRVLETANYFDASLKTLWGELQSIPQYFGKTSVIITTDHGRGGSLEDWSRHGPDVEGAEHIWIAAVGPDTPAAGEVRNAPTYFQKDVAPTILDLAGLDHGLLQGAEGKPIPALLKP